MTSIFEKAFGYQGDTLNLPVPNLDAAIPFYEKVFGFRVESRGKEPHRSAILARDHVRIGLAENGGDPTQDGCAFHVQGLDALMAELSAKGMPKEEKDVGIEDRRGVPFRVFYAIAPDGLCFWFGERQEP